MWYLNETNLECFQRRFSAKTKSKTQKNVNIELHLRVPSESKRWLCNGNYTNGNNKELKYIEDCVVLDFFDKIELRLSLIESC